MTATGAVKPPDRAGGVKMGDAQPTQQPKVTHGVRPFPEIGPSGERQWDEPGEGMQ